MVELHYPKVGEAGGRPPIPLERMLRAYFLQLWFNLSDPAVEEALYDSVAMRSFVGVDLGQEGAPDETTVCKFRHLLERHKLGKKLLATVNGYLARNGIKISNGTIVDATIISAPSSTKNKDGKRDPEMHQTAKGRQWYFGMKAHVAVDSRHKLIHTVLVVPRDKRRATEWFTKAAKWFTQAAPTGFPEAEYLLGKLYEFGEGIPLDPTRAAEWLTRAAKQSYVPAQVDLGVLDSEGRGVPRDFRQAAEWFRRAAERGNAVAQYDLSVLYQKGEGVPRNDFLAYMLTDLAAVNGYQPALSPRKVLRRHLSAAEIAKAHSLATTWIVDTPLPTTAAAASSPESGRTRRQQ